MALQITKRPATIQDFLKNKGTPPWSKYRRTAKAENFSLLFGCAPGRFGQTLRTVGFSEKDCDDLIKDAGLTDVYKEKLSKLKPGEDALDAKYYTCAKFMRDGFFAGYKGLEDRLAREQQYAMEHGYIRCWHGPFRWIPELPLFRFNEFGPVGADKELWSKMFSELKNVASNSSIQTMEVRIAFPTIHYCCECVRKWHFKSFMYSMCHDSQDWVIYDKELPVILALIAYASRYRREPDEVLMSMDAEISDISEGYENECYHHGHEEESGDIHEELAKYNALYGTNLELPPIYN